MKVLHTSKNSKDRKIPWTTIKQIFIPEHGLDNLPDLSWWGYSWPTLNTTKNEILDSDFIVEMIFHPDWDKESK